MQNMPTFLRAQRRLMSHMKPYFFSAGCPRVTRERVGVSAHGSVGVFALPAFSLLAVDRIEFSFGGVFFGRIQFPRFVLLFAFCAGRGDTVGYKTQNSYR